MEHIITAEHLTKEYKSFIAVNDVSIHIRQGSIYGFLGIFCSPVLFIYGDGCVLPCVYSSG